jgi:hypothetical protein
MDYDQLADLATHHMKLREILMLSAWDDKRYSKSTVHGNLTLLKPGTIRKISDVIVGIGHGQLRRSTINDG